MDPNRLRIQEDLRGLIAGDVRCDRVTLQQYATDASIFQVLPLGVVRPHHHDDVVAIVKYAHQHALPVIARGGGSGLAGECLGPGLIVDFSHAMCGISAMGRDTITVQPGAILSNLNRYLAKHGRVFGPDPATRSFSTVGSSIARDAAGSHWPDCGSCGDKVVRLRLVLADGNSVEVGGTADADNTQNRASRLILQSSVASCLQRFAGVSGVGGNQQSNATEAAGYRFGRIKLENEIDLLPLLIGSEGTLALITEAVLQTDPIPNHRGVALIFFSKITDAARVSTDLARLEITACDLVDRRLLSIARESDPRYAEMIPVAAEAMLLVEAKDDHLPELIDKLKIVVGAAEDRLAQSLPCVITTDDEKRDFCWRLVRRIIPTLYRLKGSTRAIPYIEDILVPPQNLEQFLILAQGLFNQHQITTSVFAHATQSRVHLRPLIDIASPSQLKMLVRLSEKLYSYVWHLGGTVGAHGGLGYSRTPFLRQQAGPNYSVLAEIKRIFDPTFILNPGKIIQNGVETHLDSVRWVLPQTIEESPNSPRDSETPLEEIKSLDLIADDVLPERSASRSTVFADAAVLDADFSDADSSRVGLPDAAATDRVAPAALSHGGDAGANIETSAGMVTGHRLPAGPAPPAVNRIDAARGTGESDPRTGTDASAANDLPDAAEAARGLSEKRHPAAISVNPPHRLPEAAGSTSIVKMLTILQPELQWDSESLAHATRNCNGCGRCRTEGTIERMCPMFRAENSEEASPRAKANLMRGVMTGQLDPAALGSEEMKAVTDTCFNCHQCRLDCPASVDIPKIANEMRAQYWANNGLSFSERIVNRLDWLFRIASFAPLLTNFLLSRRSSRWVLAKTLGVAQSRKLPKFHHRTFLAWARRRRPNKRSVRSQEPGTAPPRKVVLFADAFVNWNDPELGRALVEVLEHNGVVVSVPQNQRISGLSLISAGALGPARKIAQANVAILAEAIRGGAEVVTTEPAATLALKHEYLHILPDSDAKLVAENTFEATEYLWRLHQLQKLKTDFQSTPITVAHHLPCHQRATVNGNPGVELLRLIPDLEVVAIEKGCSGMAGMFGVYAKNYWRSLKIGHELIREIRKPIYLAGTTECSSCRIQMEQGSTKPTVHPIKILARAYGLMPELKDVFTRKGSARILS